MAVCSKPSRSTLGRRPVKQNSLPVGFVGLLGPVRTLDGESDAAVVGLFEFTLVDVGLDVDWKALFVDIQ